MVVSPVNKVSASVSRPYSSARTGVAVLKTTAAVKMATAEFPHSCIDLVCVCKEISGLAVGKEFGHWKEEAIPDMDNRIAIERILVLDCVTMRR